MTNLFEKQALWEAAAAKLDRQNASRGDWPDPRDARMPDPPWPAPDDPTLRALLDQARQNVKDGSVETALLHLATHCWFEGGVEGYDRGQRDARSELGD